MAEQALAEQAALQAAMYQQQAPPHAALHAPQFANAPHELPVPAAGTESTPAYGTPDQNWVGPVPVMQQDPAQYAPVAPPAAPAAAPAPIPAPLPQQRPAA
jgi:hypothetical protein